eukprot:COSAG05_NODE_2196_length_3411_cov_2.646739_4_plen_176_part_00
MAAQFAALPAESKRRTETLHALYQVGWSGLKRVALEANIWPHLPSTPAARPGCRGLARWQVHNALGYTNICLKCIGGTPFFHTRGGILNQSGLAEAIVIGAGHATVSWCARHRTAIEWAWTTGRGGSAPGRSRAGDSKTRESSSKNTHVTAPPTPTAAASGKKSQSDSDDSDDSE